MPLMSIVFSVNPSGFICATSSQLKISSEIIININSKNKISPGLFPLHYSPGLPLRMNAKKNKKNEAFLVLKKRENKSRDIYYLSKTNNLNEAARNQNSVLRKIKKDKKK